MDAEDRIVNIHIAAIAFAAWLIGLYLTGDVAGAFILLLPLFVIVASVYFVTVASIGLLFLLLQSIVVALRKLAQAIHSASIR